MNLKATELRKGLVLIKDGQLQIITEYSHHTPGNWRAIIQVKTRNLQTGQNGSFRPAAGEQFEVAYLDKKKCQYLYQEANGNYCFMDAETYEQFQLEKEMAEDKMRFVRESDEIEVTFHETTAVSIELPPQVVLEITEAELAVKGNSATNVKKDAVLETGAPIRVPLHINAGEKVKVSTDTGEFMGRASE
ncbi:Elongation factor P [Planctomycetes bacterium Poly30]|uniref:Elongation factor P n=1 Tax=Saltatorellus ferox TaxID=2528018 RepID=A0A518EU20_9BACT|nr:Elongation factor P [Planctomycetes bacterium Poly30]